MIRIRPISNELVAPVAVMVGELLEKIMTVIGTRAFDFNVDSTSARLSEYVERGIYVGHVANGHSYRHRW